MVSELVNSFTSVTTVPEVYYGLIHHEALLFFVTQDQGSILLFQQLTLHGRPILVVIYLESKLGLSESHLFTNDWIHFFDVPGRVPDNLNIYTSYTIYFAHIPLDVTNKCIVKRTSSCRHGHFYIDIILRFDLNTVYEPQINYINGNLRIHTLLKSRIYFFLSYDLRRHLMSLPLAFRRSILYHRFSFQ